MVISVIYCACALGVEETCARAIKQRLLFSFRRTLKVEFELYNNAFLRI
jgi:hypothetical protein